MMQIFRKILLYLSFNKKVIYIAIGNRKVMVVSNPNFNLLATIKYNTIARTPAKTAFPTISFTKIHLKSNNSQPGILFFYRS